MKKHYATKLKEENAKLISDIRKIVNGDISMQINYKMQFDVSDDLEKAIWMGTTSFICSYPKCICPEQGYCKTKK